MPGSHEGVEEAAVAGGLLIAVVLGDLVQVAETCGAGAVARRLPWAIAPSEREALLRELRQAFIARGNPAAVGERLLRLDRAAREMAVLEGLIATCSDLDAESVRAGGVVDLMHVAVQAGPMEAPRKRSGPAWEKYVRELVKAGDDKALIEHATSDGFAETASYLAILAGITEESISRVRTGHRPFSSTTREWLQRYLLSPTTPPPPMATSPGPKARPGATAPQIWMRGALRDRFMAAAKRFGGQRAVLDWMLRDYLDSHTGDRLPAPAVPEGKTDIRTRIDHDLLAALDARGGGPGARGAHLRAAIAEALPKLERSGLSSLPPLRRHAA